MGRRGLHTPVGGARRPFPASRAVRMSCGGLVKAPVLYSWSAPQHCDSAWIAAQRRISSRMGEFDYVSLLRLAERGAITDSMRNAGVTRPHRCAETKHCVIGVYH